MKRAFVWIIFAFAFSSTYAQAVRIAVYQYAENPRVENLLSLASHLQASGIPATVKSYPTVHALIAGMQKGEVDLAFISTFGYLLLQADQTTHPMTTLAALVAAQAKDNYKTAIVSRQTAGINTLSDLAANGTRLRMAFVAKVSTSGNLVPRLLLGAAGIKDAGKHFSSVHYAGTHARAITWLLSDSADVAAMGSTEWEKLDSAQKKSLQLVSLSAEIPLGPVLINKRLGKGLQHQLGETLLQLHIKNKHSLDAIKAAWSEAKQATHFIAITPAYYKPYLQQFGNAEEVQTVIKEFVSQ